MEVTLHRTEREPLKPAETDALAHAVPLSFEPIENLPTAGTFDLAWLLTTKVEPAVAYYVYVKWQLRNRIRSKIQRHWRGLPTRLLRRARWRLRCVPQIQRQLLGELLAGPQLGRRPM